MESSSEYKQKTATMATEEKGTAGDPSQPELNGSEEDQSPHGPEEEEMAEAEVEEQEEPVPHVNVYTQANAPSAAHILQQNIRSRRNQDLGQKNSEAETKTGSRPDRNAGGEPEGKKWYAVRRHRVQAWRDTKHRFRKTKIADWESVAEENVAKWLRERVKEPIRKRCVEVVSGDWGEVLTDLTKQYGKTFVLTGRADLESPGGQFWTGAANAEANLMRRTNACFFLPEQRDEGAGYDVGEQEALLGQAKQMPIHIVDMHILIRGPEELPDFSVTWAKDIKRIGYRHLPRNETVPFFYMPFAVPDTRDQRISKSEIADFLDTLAEKQLETAIDAQASFILLQDFGPGTSPWMGAKAYAKAISKFPDAFDKIVFCVHPRCLEAYKQTLGGKVHRRPLCRFDGNGCHHPAGKHWKRYAHRESEEPEEPKE